MKTKKLTIILILLSIVLTGLYVLPGLSASNYQYFLSRRLPKVLAIILTGGTIAFSTITFQTITNNRILTPSMLGLDSLFMLIQTVIVFVLGSSSILIVDNNINFVLTTSIMVVTSLFLFKYVLKRLRNNILFLLLIGTVGSTLFRSITSFMQKVIDPNEFNIIQNKMFASFNNMNTNILFIALILILLIIPFVYDDIKLLDVMGLGKDNALNLGVDYNKMISKHLVIIAILLSISTALVGPITFLGLLIVNLTRQIINTYKHTHLILISILLSIVFLIGGQLIVERVLNFNTTLSVIINFVGGLYMILILLKENKE